MLFSAFGLFTAEAMICDADAEVLQLSPVQRSAWLSRQKIFNVRTAILDEGPPARHCINAFIALPDQEHEIRQVLGKIVERLALTLGERW